jgi:hypothetical protein
MPPMTGMDARLYSPSAARNRDPILATLRRHLPPRGLVLEVASGSGEHALHLAAALPNLTFQPSDANPEARASITAWAKAAGLPNIHPPLALDAAAPDWPIGRANVVLCINMVHIAPWAACEGLVAGAARVLLPGGTLALYGPFKREGRHTGPGNENFDAELRARDPAWGLRDLEAVVQLAAGHGFGPPVVEPMPADNLTVLFHLERDLLYTGE